LIGFIIVVIMGQAVLAPGLAVTPVLAQGFENVEPVVAVPAACPSLSYARGSIHAVYIEQSRVWATRTEDGFLGVDGGLLSILGCR
jgi:hypothetical protein